eukprot:gnl/Chilomastix_caulleri/2145.p1 GENE.gnl/Chilomastix_caulleri/2145~~gnl/Chilomastix_caulleri/2145.p1  ORF type:complete len:185 (-),score=4.43 gnl/Chilomastix_caulleri/2145:53-607(-)
MAVVDSMFEPDALSRMETLENTELCDPWADISRLHSTRVAFYPTVEDIGHEYNVDTNIDRQVVSDRVWSFPCLTGIDVGVLTVFHAEATRETWTLAYDGPRERIGDESGVAITLIIPSESEPEILSDSLRMYWTERFYVRDSKVKFPQITPFSLYHTFVRLYKDVFIVHLRNKSRWALIRIKVK